MGTMIAKLTCMGGKEKCCCCPLALCCLLASIYWGVTGAFQVMAGLRDIENDNIDYAVLVPGAFNCFIALGGILSAFCKCACGALIIFYFYFVAWITNVITFIVQWVDWGQQISDDKLEVDWQMISYTVVAGSSIIAGWCVCNIYYSLYEMQSNGKTGW